MILMKRNLKLLLTLYHPGVTKICKPCPLANMFTMSLLPQCSASSDSSFLPRRTSMYALVRRRRLSRIASSLFVGLKIKFLRDTKWENGYNGKYESRKENEKSRN